MHTPFKLFLVATLFLISCSARGDEDEDASTMMRIPGGLVAPSKIQVKQAPTGIARQVIKTLDNQISWSAAIQFPQPGGSIDDELGIMLMFRVQPGNFYSAANEPLKLIARIQWSIGNDFDLATIDVPSNSNIRVPLNTGKVSVQLATVLTTNPAAIFAVGQTDFFENPPASQFRQAVIGGNPLQALCVASVGIAKGAGYGPLSGALPQRQMQVLLPASVGNVIVPRPSGAANFQYIIPTGETITVQQVVLPVLDYAAQGPGVPNKLLTEAYGVVLNNGAATPAVVAVTFDIGF